MRFYFFLGLLLFVSLDSLFGKLDKFPLERDAGSIIEHFGNGFIDWASGFCVGCQHDREQIL